MCTGIKVCTTSVNQLSLYQLKRATWNALNQPLHHTLPSSLWQAKHSFWKTQAMPRQDNNLQLFPKIVCFLHGFFRRWILAVHRASDRWIDVVRPSVNRINRHSPFTTRSIFGNDKLISGVRYPVVHLPVLKLSTSSASCYSSRVRSWVYFPNVSPLILSYFWYLDYENVCCMENNTVSF